MDNYKRYAELKEKEAVIKNDLKVLGNVILEDIGDKPRMANGFGLFSKVIRKTYKFSKRLNEREAEAKEVIARAKEREVRNGAKFQESSSLRYNFPNGSK